MAELTSKERLQPSLLDRLTDNEPEAQQESRDKRVLSTRQLKQSVLRDLEWLLNAGNLGDQVDYEAYPYIEQSVVNYGIEDLSGQLVAGLTTTQLERLVRQAILDFEPRILRNSIKIRTVVDRSEMNRNAVAFEIEGELWGQPMPQRLYLRTEVDLESGSFSLSEGGG